MAYVVLAVFEFDNVEYGDILLGVVNNQTEAFSMIENFDLKNEFKDMFMEDTTVVWNERRYKEFGMYSRTNQVYYEELIYTDGSLSEVCGSVMFRIYEVKGKLVTE